MIIVKFKNIQKKCEVTLKELVALLCCVQIEMCVLDPFSFSGDYKMTSEYLKFKRRGINL